jgi:hypothetical protein
VRHSPSAVGASARINWPRTGGATPPATGIRCRSRNGRSRIECVASTHVYALVRISPISWRLAKSRGGCHPSAVMDAAVPGSPDRRRGAYGALAAGAPRSPLPARGESAGMHLRGLRCQMRRPALPGGRSPVADFPREPPGPPEGRPARRLRHRAPGPRRRPRRGRRSGGFSRRGHSR